MKGTAREFGRLRILLLWLHAFEEPFYSVTNCERLTRTSLFGNGTVRFVGALCRLTLRKEDHANEN
jgi:hypothetical protein